MNITIDTSTAFIIICSVGALFWLLLKLKVDPIYRILKEWSPKIDSIKDEVAQNNAIDVKIARHERYCRQDRLSETGVFKTVPGGKKIAH